METTWDIEIIWKNTNTGETVNRETHTGYTSRIDAETEFAKHYTVGGKTNIIPICYLDSSVGHKETLDPFGYFRTQKPSFGLR